MRQTLQGDHKEEPFIEWGWKLRTTTAKRLMSGIKLKNHQNNDQKARKKKGDRRGGRIESNTSQFSPQRKKKDQAGTLTG